MVCETEVYINKQIGHVPCDVEQRNAIVILMQFVPSCIVCLDEINPVAHPIMGGKLEVLQKIKNYLQLIKLKPPPSAPHPKLSHKRLNLPSFDSN